VRLSPREAVLAFATLTVVVLGASSVLVRPRIEEWQELRRKQADTMLRIEQDRTLVGKRDEYAQELRDLSKMLRAFPVDKKMDVYWLSVMDGIATKHGAKLSKRQAGAERRHGDVYEMLIECKEWEANLNGLVHFLFDLQAVGAMFQMRQLLVKPKAKGVLRGRFSLYCAYTRESEDAASRASAPPESETGGKKTTAGRE